MLQDSVEELLIHSQSEEEGIPLLSSSQETTTHRNARKRLTPEVQISFSVLVVELVRMS